MPFLLVAVACLYHLEVAASTLFAGGGILFVAMVTGNTELFARPDCDKVEIRQTVFLALPVYSVELTYQEIRRVYVKPESDSLVLCLKQQTSQSDCVPTCVSREGLTQRPT